MCICGSIRTLTIHRTKSAKRDDNSKRKRKENIQMSIYKIPLKYKPGEFPFHEIDTDEGDCLTLDYDSEYQLLTYNVPLYGGEARLYTVPRELMPEALTAVYDGNGDIEKVMLSGTRLLYIYFKNVMVPERVILKFVKAEADRVSDTIMKRKQTLARIFFEKFYDGEAVDIAAKTATAGEVQAVIDKYDGDVTVADNSGDFPIENRLALEYEALGVMLMCADGLLRNRLFEKAAETFVARVKSRVLKKIETTEDFKFIVEEYD